MLFIKALDIKIEKLDKKIMKNIFKSHAYKE
jgi:hypothetical protein